MVPPQVGDLAAGGLAVLGVSPKALAARLMALAGVKAVHDLHVSTITSGLDATNCHLVVDDPALYRVTLQAAHDMMRDEFGIKKTTILIEHKRLHAVADDHRHQHDHGHAH